MPPCEGIPGMIHWQQTPWWTYMTPVVRALGVATRYEAYFACYRCGLDPGKDGFMRGQQ